MQIKSPYPMQTQAFQYVLSLEFTEYNLETDQEAKTETENSEIIDSDPLRTRALALVKAKDALLALEKQKQRKQLPLMSYPKAAHSEINHFICYRAIVRFSHPNETHTIYTSETWEQDSDTEEMMLGLKQEYLSLSSAGIDLKSCTETVKYHDHADGKNKKTNIIPNGRKWAKISINYHNSEEYRNLMELFDPKN